MPSSSPSSSPSIALSIGLQFNVTQQLSGIDSHSYNPDKDNERFANSLASVVLDLKAKHITVLLTTDAVATSKAARVSSSTASAVNMMLTYQVKASMQELEAYANKDEAYSNLTKQINSASVGVSCPLEQSLQSTGGSFSQVTVPAGSSPEISSAKEVYMHTPSPSTLPTMAPTCRAGRTGDDCATTCPKGTYAPPGASDCIKCPEGTYNDLQGSSSCRDCPWPSTSFSKGSSACNSVKLDFSVAAIAITISIVISLYIFGLSVAKKKRYFFTLTVLSMLDTLSDFLNLTTTTWATNALFHLDWLTILGPNIVLFMYDIYVKKVLPRFFGESYWKNIIWLTCNNKNYVPEYREERILRFENYDDIPKNVLWLACWIVSILAQCLWAVVVGLPLIIVNLSFYLVMFVIGAIFFASRMITCVRMYLCLRVFTLTNFVYLL